MSVLRPGALIWSAHRPDPRTAAAARLYARRLRSALRKRPVAEARVKQLSRMLAGYRRNAWCLGLFLADYGDAIDMECRWAKDWRTA